MSLLQEDKQQLAVVEQHQRRKVSAGGRKLPEGRLQKDERQPKREREKLPLSQKRERQLE